jgi:hypothetical protein
MVYRPSREEYRDFHEAVPIQSLGSRAATHRDLQRDLFLQETGAVRLGVAQDPRFFYWQAAPGKDDDAG